MSSSNIQDVKWLKSNWRQSSTPRVRLFRLDAFYLASVEKSSCFVCDSGHLPGLKAHVALVPLSSGNDIVGVILPSCGAIDVFIGVDIFITHVVGSYSSCRDDHTWGGRKRSGVEICVSRSTKPFRCLFAFQLLKFFLIWLMNLTRISVAWIRCSTLSQFPSGVHPLPLGSICRNQINWMKVKVFLGDTNEAAAFDPTCISPKAVRDLSQPPCSWFPALDSLEMMPAMRAGSTSHFCPAWRIMLLYFFILSKSILAISCDPCTPLAEIAQSEIWVFIIWFSNDVKGPSHAFLS